MSDIADYTHEDLRRPPEADDDPDNTAPSTERLASIAHEAIDRVCDTAGEAELQLRDRAGHFTARARASRERARKAAREGAAEARGCLRRNPFMSAGLAFTAGVVASMLLRR